LLVTGSVSLFGYPGNVFQGGEHLVVIYCFIFFIRNRHVVVQRGAFWKKEGAVAGGLNGNRWQGVAHMNGNGIAAACAGFVRNGQHGFMNAIMGK
jgi:hypothetical protein